jgi:hypothetical protein
VEQLAALIQTQQLAANGNPLAVEEAALASQRLVRFFELLLTISAGSH